MLLKRLSQPFQRGLSEKLSSKILIGCYTSRRHGPHPSCLTENQYGGEEGDHDGDRDGQHTQLTAAQQQLFIGVLAAERVEDADHERHEHDAAEHAVVGHAERLTSLRGIHLETGDWPPHSRAENSTLG